MFSFDLPFRAVASLKLAENTRPLQLPAGESRKSPDWERADLSYKTPCAETRQPLFCIFRRLGPGIAAKPDRKPRQCGNSSRHSSTRRNYVQEFLSMIHNSSRNGSITTKNSENYVCLVHYFCHFDRSAQSERSGGHFVSGSFHLRICQVLAPIFLVTISF